jgi:amino acid permease
VPDRRTHTAGALDIRAIIAYLMATYGVILVVMGLVAYDDAAEEQTGGFNINLWAGIGMLVFAAAFLLWNKLNPTKVPDGQAEHDD